MSFLHPALLAGFGLVAIPIILHLWLRPRPKRLPFPALRLLRSRQKHNSRRLKLRHLWLLLLRMAVVGLMVLAVTRPTLPPANYALTWRESLTAVLIIAAALGAYGGVVHAWKKRDWPRHVWLTRRTVLRGVVGGATAVLLLLGVAWPYQRRVAAEIVAPPAKAGATLPVAAVYLFDTSLSLDYQRQNRTRLQSAQELAGAHLGRLPSGSKVAIADSATSSPLVFSADLAAAQSRLDGLKTQPIHRPLEDRVRSAIHALENDRKKTLTDQSGVAEELQQDRFLREIYLFTDLAKSAWKAETGSQLREEIAARPWLGVYLVDVGVDDPTNVSLTHLKLSREAIPEGSQFFVEATLRTVGDVPSEQTVELELRDDTGSAVKVDQQRVSSARGGEAVLKFLVDLSVDSVHGRYRQGQLKLVGADPLSRDDQVYFTVRILPPRKVLVVCDRKGDVGIWLDVLNSLVQGKRAAFETQFVATGNLTSVELEDFDVVCLINAGRPEPAAWERLRSFVEAGGGLFVALGAANAVAVSGRSGGIDPLAYDVPTAQELLPGRLKASLPFRPASTIDFRDTTHPLVQRMDEIPEAIPTLGETEIRRYWSVTPDPAAVVISPYAVETRPPALLERAVGRGRVLLLTTAVNSAAWNDLMQSWAFLVMVDQTMNYLTAATAGRVNGTVGTPVQLRIDPEPRDRSCILRMPDFKQLPRDIPKLAGEVSFRDLPAPGHYELVSANDSTDFAAGFSLNLPAEESDLTRLTKVELDNLFGEQRYAVSRDVDSLVRNVTTGRLGQEVYGLIVAVLIGVFVLEQMTAAWFYRTDEAAAEVQRSDVVRRSTSPPIVMANRA